jgi:membrane-associated phospholipid phosphatase
VRVRLHAIRLAALVAALTAAGLPACATLPGGPAWGEDATARPGWRRAAASAVTAVSSPSFWLPLAGAAVFQIDGWDRKVSNWARRRTPVFGSEQNAVAWSDRLRSASGFAWAATAAATPGGPDPGEWLEDKARGALVGLAAIGATDEESALLKNAAARERPNGQDTQSMPSSHASRSAVLTELGRRDLDWVGMSDATRWVLDSGLTALTLGTSWARVEAGFHYPSDTLVGMAIGDFNGAFFSDAFLGAPRRTRTALAIEPQRGGATLEVRISF